MDMSIHSLSITISLVQQKLKKWCHEPNRWKFVKERIKIPFEGLTKPRSAEMSEAADTSTTVRPLPLARLPSPQKLFEGQEDNGAAGSSQS